MVETFAGPAAALGAAGLWAGAVMLFRAPIEVHGARSVNLAKCVLATLLQGATVLAIGQGAALVSAPPAALAALVGSGLVGLTLGDTALFAAVGRIGPHRTLLLQTTAPIFTAAIAFLWWGELPRPLQGVGALAILAGVAIVIGPPRRRPRPPMSAVALAGLALGLLAAFGQASGIVLAKRAMEVVPSMPASVIRLAAASLGLVAMAVVGGRTRTVRRLVDDAQAVRRVVPATFLGTYLAMFLFMAGIALAPAAIAAVLLSTSPVFTLVLEAVAERRPIALSGAVGTLLAVAGVALLVTG